MSALTQARMPIETRYKSLALPLASGAGMKAWVGGIACLDTVANVAKPGASGNANLVKVGEWMENVDNSGGSAPTQVLVSLDHEVVVRWYDNATGGAAVTTSNLFATAYMLDDHTVTSSSSGNSAIGRVWALDPIKGVAVETTAL